MSDNRTEESVLEDFARMVLRERPREVRESQYLLALHTVVSACEQAHFMLNNPLPGVEGT